MKWIWRINLLMWLIIYIIVSFWTDTNDVSKLTSLVWVVGSAIGCTVEMAKEEIIKKLDEK